jgi:polar amino acid transport system ATP-binding protein
MSLIAITDVRKSFGSNEVLKGIDIDIARGEVIAIIGKSGSGKSTLLRCINGLETIDSGSISVSGAQLLTDASALRELRLKVGMIFQQFNLFPHLTAGRNVMLSQMVVKKTPKEQAAAIARDMLERVGLSEKFDAYPDQLSGGQQQRVAIARALAMQPIALLCDEITSALDPELVAEVLAVVKGLAAEGMTLVMVTHEMRFARDVCSRVVFMHQGRVHEIGPPEEVFANPKTPELQQFLGMSQAA